MAKRSNFSSVVSAPVMPPPLVMGDSTPNLAEDEAHPFSSKLINVPSSAFSVASVKWLNAWDVIINALRF